MLCALKLNIRETIETLIFGNLALSFYNLLNLNSYGAYAQEKIHGKSVAVRQFQTNCTLKLKLQLNYRRFLLGLNNKLLLTIQMRMAEALVCIVANKLLELNKMILSAKGEIVGDSAIVLLCTTNSHDHRLFE